MATSHPRRFRFATELHEPFEGRSWADTFREVESLGYATMFMPDHFDEGVGPLAGLAMAAAVTTTLHVGPLVLDCDFRHPVPLARELATIDQMSEGRLEVGLGAGWKTLDYEHSGIVMDRPGVRVSRMIEHTKVLKALFSDGPVTFDGEYYSIHDLEGTPKPHRPGGPPILIGGGAPRLLRFAGSVADIVGVNASIHSGEIDAPAAQDGLATQIDRKVAWVREGAADRFEQLELNAWLAIAEITEDADGFATLIAPAFESDAQSILESPLALIGTATQIAERLEERRERWGYSYHVIPGDKARDFAPVVAAITGT